MSATHANQATAQRHSAAAVATTKTAYSYAPRAPAEGYALVLGLHKLTGCSSKCQPQLCRLVCHGQRCCLLINCQVITDDGCGRRGCSGHRHLGLWQLLLLRGPALAQRNAQAFPASRLNRDWCASGSATDSSSSDAGTCVSQASSSRRCVSQGAISSS